jgi:hypothetical protein
MLILLTLTFRVQLTHMIVLCSEKSWWIYVQRIIIRSGLAYGHDTTRLYFLIKWGASFEETNSDYSRIYWVVQGNYVYRYVHNKQLQIIWIKFIYIVQRKYAKLVYILIDSLHRKKYFSFWTLNISILCTSQLHFLLESTLILIAVFFVYSLNQSFLLAHVWSDIMLCYGKRKQCNFSLYLYLHPL